MSSAIRRRISLQKKLIALDLDGTVLDPHSKITEKTKTILKRAQQAGHVVSIVTGRPYRLAAKYYDELNLKTPMINFNGALVHIPHLSWRKEYQKTFPKEIIAQLLGKKEQLGIQAITVEAKQSFLIEHAQNVHSPFFPDPVTETQVLKKSHLKKNPAAATLLVKQQRENQLAVWLKEKFGNQVNVGVWGGPAPIIELAPHGINKAFGLAYLADYFGFLRQDILAFGDEHNDQEMIAYAGWGVAMKNGTDTLKKVANDITALDNAHDGLADYLAAKLHL
jgi:Cof subfamily protein (haloacid dehalogenase superfamily)